jgi:hypothetical protein
MTALRPMLAVKSDFATARKQTLRLTTLEVVVAPVQVRTTEWPEHNASRRPKC